MRGILINKTIHTGEDLGVVMISKDIPAPKPQTFTVSIPGRNGVLDLSEALTGEVAYNNRILKFTFVGDGSRERVLSLIDEFLIYHGQYITVTTDDYPEWYYSGRADVTYNDKGYFVEITLTVDAQPFKEQITPRTYVLKDESYYEITLKNNGFPVIPRITTTENIEILILTTGETVYLSAGTYDIESLKIPTGSIHICIYSDNPATVTITYRERLI